MKCLRNYAFYAKIPSALIIAKAFVKEFSTLNVGRKSNNKI